MEFYSGASVILEAPAKLEIVSANGGILHAGKLRAQVPLHAHGFTITTNNVQLVNLGTSFGMEVGADTGTAIHVFDGKVELFGKNRDRHLGEGYELLAGEGRHVNRTGKASAIAAAADPPTLTRNRRRLSRPRPRLSNSSRNLASRERRIVQSSRLSQPTSIPIRRAGCIATPTARGCLRVQYASASGVRTRVHHSFSAGSFT